MYIISIWGFEFWILLMTKVNLLILCLYAFLKWNTLFLHEEFNKKITLRQYYRSAVAHVSDSQELLSCFTQDKTIAVSLSTEIYWRDSSALARFKSSCKAKSWFLWLLRMSMLIFRRIHSIPSHFQFSWIA